MLEGDAEGCVEQMRSILSPPDVAVVTGELGGYMVARLRAALSRGVDGWIDDDFAFVKPWGFHVDGDRAAPCRSGRASRT